MRLPLSERRAAVSPSRSIRTSGRVDGGARAMPSAAMTRGACLPQAEPQSAEHDEYECRAGDLRQHGDCSGPARNPLTDPNHRRNAEPHPLERPCFETERHGEESEQRHGHDQQTDDGRREQIGDQPIFGHAVEMKYGKGRDRGAGDEGGKSGTCNQSPPLMQRRHTGLTSTSPSRWRPASHS
jgi:hypothetical protein